MPDTAETREVLEKLGSKAVHVRGDVFEAKPRANVLERRKSTPARRRARRSNVEGALIEHKRLQPTTRRR